MKEEVVFRSKFVWHTNRQTDTLVICCSSYDVSPYFTEFLRTGLNIKEWDELVIPGGIQILTMLQLIPKAVNVLLRFVKFLIKRHQIKRLVLIGHQECGWYAAQFLRGKEDERQKRDLVVMTEWLTREFSPAQVKVEAYYLSHGKDGQVVFSSLKP
jgi:hypothetical protein